MHDLINTGCKKTLTIFHENVYVIFQKKAYSSIVNNPTILSASNPFYVKRVS